MPEPELTEKEKTERVEMKAIKDKHHHQYLDCKRRGVQKTYEKAYNPRRRARLKQLKSANPNTFSILVEEYDKEHFTRVRVVLVSSEKADI